jgi:hypothetical protein
MAKTLQAVFEDVRQEMDDVNGNTFKDSVLLTPFNRIYRELGMFLVELGAEVHRIGPIEVDLTAVTTEAVDPATVPGAVYKAGDTTTTHYRWALPDAFLCFVQDFGNRIYTRFRRADGSIDAEGIWQYDRKNTHHSQQPISVGNTFIQRTAAPRFLFVHRDGSTQYFSFDVHPDTADVTGMLFWYFPLVSDYSIPTNEVMPWFDILNDVFVTELKFWAHNWKEFGTEIEGVRMAIARNRAQEILGLRINDNITVNPSIWKGFPTI